MNTPVGTMRPEEAGSVTELWIRAGLTRPWNDPAQDIQFALRSPASTILVARAAGAIAAAAMVGHDGHRGAIYYVATDPEYRGQGFGRLIMTAAETWLRDQGVSKLNLLIRAENHGVRGFYEALGYASQDRISMQKEIAPAAARKNPEALQAASAVILRRDSVLMVERGRPPSKGLWSFPGGRAEPGEAAEATARRELREETRLEVGPLVRLGAFQPGPGASPLMLTVFAGRGGSADPEPGDDAVSAEFVPFARVLARPRTAGSVGWIARAVAALSIPPLL